MKGKIFLIVGILILLLGIPAGIFLISQKTGFRLGAKNSNSPENLQIMNITDQSATISWTTKNPVQGFISYGISPTNLTLIKPESAPAINHQINLEKLMAGSSYFFTIKVGETVFDNDGQPYTFTTLTQQITPTPTVFIPKLTEEGMQAVMGTNNPIYDLNQDGVVNSVDLLLLRGENK